MSSAPGAAIGAAVIVGFRDDDLSGALAALGLVVRHVGGTGEEAGVDDVRLVVLPPRGAEPAPVDAEALRRRFPGSRLVRLLPAADLAAAGAARAAGVDVVPVPVRGARATSAL